MFYKEDWNTGKYGSIKKLINFALEKKSTSGHDSIVSALIHGSANEASYWLNIADELCRENLYWDAIDCWKHAAQVDPKNKVSILVEMADTLDNTDDNYLRDFATQTYIEISKIKPTKEVFQLLATRANNKNEILGYLEKALDFGEDLDWEDIGNIEIGNLSPDCSSDQITNFLDLGDIYLWNNQIGHAFRCYAKAIKHSTNQKNELFCSALFELNLYAQVKKFPIESFLPESIFLSINEDQE